MEKILATVVLVTLVITGYIVYKSRLENDTSLEDGSSWTASVVKSKPDPNIPVLVSTLSGSSSPKTIIKKPENKNKLNLNGTQYRLIEFNNSRVSLEKPYTILFNNGNISGRICNTYNGEYSINSNKLYATKIISTKMACVGEAQTLEDSLFKLVNEGALITQDREFLTLQSASGSTMVFNIYMD